MIVLFWIEPENNVDLKTTVYVSRTFTCDEDPVTLAAALALSIYALRMLEDPAFATKIRSLMKKLQNKLAQDQVRKKQEEEKRKKERKGRRDNCGEEKANHGSGGGSGGDNDSGQGHEDEGRHIGKDSRDASGKGKDSGSGSAGNGSGCNRSKNEGCESGESYAQDEVEKYKLVGRTIKHGKGEIGIGASGTVLLGQLDGKLVALKYWNRLDRAGRDAFNHEIEMYEMLHKEDSAALGTAIPGFTLVSRLDEDNPVLVTEYIGNPLERRPNGEMYLMGSDGDALLELNFADICMIATAAIRSLRALHRDCVLHGDIALRNLRVQRQCNRGERVWRARWIDLGRSQKCLDVSQFNMELAMCESLFSEVYFSDLSEAGSDVQVPESPVG